MQRLMSVLFLVVAACGGGDGGANYLPDAPGAVLDSASSSDGAAFQGLTIDWESSPALPGSLNISTMVTVTSAKFHVEKLEAISDGGSDPFTTVDDIDVVWSPTLQPQPIFFPSAPPAIYSKIRLSIDKGASNAPSVEIMGTVLVDGTTEMFKITSTQKADLEVQGYSVTLGIGESEGMPIIVKLDALLADVDWMTLPAPGSVRTLDDTRTSEMSALLDRLELAFTGPLE